MYVAIALGYFFFVSAILLDVLVMRGNKAKQKESMPSSVRPALVPAPAMRPAHNVLVVDDENTVCNSCRKILTQEGYNVEIALSGEEALNKVKGNGFDVVIADWKMPEIDGIEVARRIKKEKPNIAVIMITGYPSVESSIKAVRAGVSDYVLKPFSPQELSDAMTRALGKGDAVPMGAVRNRLIERGHDLGDRV
ncbi:MAG: response regulator [Candidatus Zixiibacteriota bacterium]|nr:MAG: response regulator [candidate division Zixibacteria bacterium]